MYFNQCLWVFVSACILFTNDPKTFGWKYYDSMHARVACSQLCLSFASLELFLVCIVGNWYAVSVKRKTYCPAPNMGSKHELKMLSFS